MTKEELMNAISGLPVKTQVYKIDDYTDLDHIDYRKKDINNEK